MNGIPIRGAAKGSAGAAFTIAKRRGAQRLDFTRDYFVSLYAVCKTLGVNADVLVAQWSEETGDGTSTYWTQDGNPAGIAAFDDGSNWGLTFTPETAAGGQAVHMCRYLGMTVSPEMQKLDARWQAVAAAGYVGKVKTTADLGNGLWATNPAYAKNLIERYTAYWGEYTDASSVPTTPPASSAPAQTGDTTVSDKKIADNLIENVKAVMKLMYGNGTMPGYIDKQEVTANKPEGIGWDNLGKRDVLGVVLHRQLGSMNGTNQFFGMPSTGALTDYGVGVAAQDGKEMAGVIYKWNDEYGYRAGWASGRVSAPYGDGLAFVNKYGVNAVNKRLVSLEISGFQDTAIDDVAFAEIVHFIAYYADKAKIAWSDFPFYGVTGMSFIFWHQEMTFGTGKLCPFNVVISRTNEIIDAVKALLKTWQTSGAMTTTPPVAVPPVIVPARYADPAPIAALALMADADFKGRQALVTTEGVKFRLVQDQVRIVKDTKRYQAASRTAKSTGPDLKVGTILDVTWQFAAQDGEEWYLTDWWTRIPVADTELFADAKAA